MYLAENGKALAEVETTLKLHLDPTLASLDVSCSYIRTYKSVPHSVVME